MNLSFNCNKHLEWNRTACYVYEIKNITPDLTSITVVITDADENVLVEQTLLPDESLTIDLVEDGVYDLTITITTTGEVFNDYLVEFCGFITCYKKIIKAVYCNTPDLDDPCDPCDDYPGCEQLDKATIEKYKAVLSQLNGLMMTYLMTVFKYRITYLQIDTFESEPQEIKDLKNLLGIINKFTKACSLKCEEEDCVNC